VRPYAAHEVEVIKSTVVVVHGLLLMGRDVFLEEPERRSEMSLITSAPSADTPLLVKNHDKAQAEALALLPLAVLLMSFSFFRESAAPGADLFAPSLTHMERPTSFST
jgi:hypothetical protein